VSCRADAELIIPGVAPARKIARGKRPILVLVLAGQLLIPGRLLGDLLPDARPRAPLHAVQVVHPAQAEQPVRAAAGHLLALRRFVHLVADQILEVQLFARTVRPAYIGSQILADYDEGPAQFLIVGGPCPHLRVAHEIHELVMLAIHHEIGFGREPLLRHLGNELILMTLTNEGRPNTHVQPVLGR